MNLLAEPGRSTAETGSALTQCELQAENGLLEIEDACGEFEAATGAAAEADPVRSLWAEIETVEAELAKVEKAARQSEARALVAKGACDTAESEIAALRQPDGKVRWRDRGALKEAQSRLDTSRPGYEQLLAAAVEARRIASAFRRDTEAAIADLSASAPLSRDEIKRRDTAAAQAEIRVRELEQAQFATLNRPWLVADPFRHCGITTLAEATSHSACLVLDTQHRFGPQVMRLANLVAYDGLLKAGRAVRSHGDDDPEIVLVDTDGLHELAEVRRVSRNAGWWAAGLLLARALVELHHEYGETTGVVTPHSVQADATLEALRDMEPGGRPLAEVRYGRALARRRPVDGAGLPAARQQRMAAERRAPVQRGHHPGSASPVCDREPRARPERQARHGIRTSRRTAARQAGTQRPRNKPDHAA